MFPGVLALISNPLNEIRQEDVDESINFSTALIRSPRFTKSNADF